MKYIERTTNPVRYHYQCISCGKRRTSKDKIAPKTLLCVSCKNKDFPTTKGTSKYGFIGERHEVNKQLKKRYYEENKEQEAKCSICGDEYTVCVSSVKDIKNLCIKCATKSKGKMKTNTSGYIGVHYKNPVIRKNRGTEQGEWRGVIVQNGLTIFKVRYKDSYAGSSEYKKKKCAIDRELHIIENDLPYTRNFTDDKLNKLCKELNMINQFDTK